MGRVVSVQDLMGLMPGEVVSTVKQGGIEHFGVLSEWHLYGQRPTIISPSKVRQAVVEEWPLHFALGAPLYAHGAWSNQPWEQTVAKARSQLGKPYRLFDGNCEHFVRYCHGLPQESPQLARAVIGAVIVGGVLAWALAS